MESWKLKNASAVRKAVIQLSRKMQEPYECQENLTSTSLKSTNARLDYSPKRSSAPSMAIASGMMSRRCKGHRQRLTLWQDVSKSMSPLST